MVFWCFGIYVDVGIGVDAGVGVVIGSCVCVRLGVVVGFVGCGSVADVGVCVCVVIR